MVVIEEEAIAMVDMVVAVVEDKGKDGQVEQDSQAIWKMKKIKFALQAQGKVMMAMYNTLKETLLVQIQKTYKNGQDVVTSIKQGTKLDLEESAPKHAINSKTGDEKAINQRALDIKYQEEQWRHLDKFDEVNQSLNKAYALIFTNYCARAMERKIEEHLDFATKVKDDAWHCEIHIPDIIHCGHTIKITHSETTRQWTPCRLCQ